MIRRESSRYTYQLVADACPAGAAAAADNEAASICRVKVADVEWVVERRVSCMDVHLGGCRGRSVR